MIPSATVVAAAAAVVLVLTRAHRVANTPELVAVAVVSLAQGPPAAPVVIVRAAGVILRQKVERAGPTVVLAKMDSAPTALKAVVAAVVGGALLVAVAAVEQVVLAVQPSWARGWIRTTMGPSMGRSPLLRSRRHLRHPHPTR